MSRRPPDDTRPPLRLVSPARALFVADLGSEPPLGTSGATAQVLDRHDLNVRWLGASILTAVAGAALLGTAIYVSLEGVTTFAEIAERVTAPLRTPGDQERTTSAARKGDKLVRSEMVASAKQSFRAPVAVRAGEREAIKMRAFTRVATALSM